MCRNLWSTFLLLVVGGCAVVSGYFEYQAKILSYDGHLIIESAKDRNISFNLKGGGQLNVGGVSIDRLINRLKLSTDTERTSTWPLLTDDAQLQQLVTYITGPNGLLKRVKNLEDESNQRNGTQTRVRTGSIYTQVNNLERKVNNILNRLRDNRCSSGPCQNGGTCLSTYGAFVCLCPKNWEGQTCTTDVNECAQFAGTDLGCQNGATCKNTHGGYSCICSDGWRGIHCNSRTQDCSTAGPELCGHGTCVQTKDGYKCICEQGWKTNGVTPACMVDIDECAESRPHCSKEPETSCINVPGSFVCGPCPAGYTGNGFYCVDINECESNNGGCSTSPSVNCINLRGSSRCGNCPPGYVGDGKTCTIEENRCRLCHPMARCIDYANNVKICSCPAGYTGNGEGPMGCYRTNVNPCSSLPCLNGGRCQAVGNRNYTCICPPGTVAPVCMKVLNSCTPNPCANGGTCIVLDGRTVCTCPNGYSGNRCQVARRTCGSVINQLSGVLRYPTENGTYNHNSRCAWLIRTNETKILNVTFTSFNLEAPLSYGECRFDWLQIHDGRTSAAQIIGRFCGNRLPHGGNFLSTHHMLYLWFRSDNSTARDGFELHWESIDPVCGGELNVTGHGRITSPGSPGNYPPNRDCKWFLVAPPGKRIQFHFFSLRIESHKDCRFDYLQIMDGIGDEAPTVAKYCNTSNPEPLTSPGNEVTVYFHSDEDGADVGFQISYATVESVPGCGGTYTQKSGAIRSPLSHVDDLYPNNMNCEYLIRLPTGNKVEVTFTKFTLEQSDGCKFDYVEIYDGASSNDNSLGRYCGDRIPPKFTSSSNKLLLKFHTDWSTSHPGFTLTYKTKCGGIFTVPGTVISSPSYPASYTPNEMCDFVIQAPLGKSIALDFLDFEIEKNSNAACDLDSLEIYNGLTAKNSSRIGRYCGSKGPERILSTMNVLLLRFVTDASIAGRGFSANFTFSDVSCGGVITAEDTIIRSPSIPETGKYQHDSECQWIIAAPAGHVIQLNWNSFELELSAGCVYDYVELYDNATRDSFIGRFCGTNKPPAITSSGDMITIRFKSDTSSSKDGFSLSFTFMDVEKMCGANYFASSGIVRSPGWPKNYPSNKICEWVITVPKGQQILLLVQSFSMEKHSICRFDGLTIRNGGTASAPLIGNFCGEDDFNGTISFSNQLYLKFFSDASRTYAGFAIEWDSAATGCGGILTAPKGAIISPNYPQPYGSNAQCNWRISVSEGSAIHIVMTDLDLETHAQCQFDFLEVYDGYDVAGKRLGKFCSSEMDPVQLDTSTNHAYIRLRSDDTNQGRGFHLKYNIICKRNVTGFGGVIESPNFPNKYPNSLDCLWNIVVSSGNQIQLEFSHFDLEYVNLLNATQSCPFDYVELREALQARRYCKEMPPATTSLGTSVGVAFRTDGSNEQNGFRLEWAIKGCGGRLKKPSGILTTPNYPKPYPPSTECFWVITTTPGRVIDLVVTDFNMESTTNCQYDGLHVSNGENNTDLITTLCHDQSDTIQVTSSGHEMYLHFYSDYSNSFKGFSAMYTTKPAKCGGQLTLREGYLSSPNYPLNYPSNASCEWLLRTDKSHTLIFSITDIGIIKSPNCTQDYVMVYDGRVRAADKLLLTSCGSEINDTVTVSSGNEMLVHFRSNEALEAKGFRANFKTNCGARINVTRNGLITLNNVNRMASENCTWILVASEPTQHVTLQVVHIGINGLFLDDCIANLSVHDGETIEAPTRFTGCGNKNPPAIVSNGNALTVNIHSEDFNLNSLSNIVFEATYTMVDNACGGKLTSQMGEFASPSYPQTYPNGIECVWQLVASAGNRLSLSIKELDLEPSEDCNKDYLEIREDTAAGKLLGDYCGTSAPLSLNSSKSFWIKFRADSAGTARGFLAEYSYDRTVELEQPSGVLTSPLYPRPYKGFDIFSWRITVSLDSVVVLKFSQFWIDREGYDSCDGEMLIYDGYDDSVTQLLEACGSTAPDVLESTSNVVYIVLDNSEVMGTSLFSLSWEEKARGNTQPSTVDELFCGGHQVIKLSDNATTYNLTSPGYPNGYRTDLNCTWMFQSSDSSFHPYLYFKYVDLEETEECLADYLEVSTSSDMVNWYNPHRICTYTLRSRIRFHGNPYLKVHFRSDYYSNRTGFTGLVKLRCGGYITEPNGVLTEPVRATFYNNATERLEMAEGCNWNISVRAGRRIKFVFELLDITRRSGGPVDGYLMIKNGIDELAPSIGTYSGTELPSNLETSSNRAFVRYKPNMEGRDRFRLVFQEVGIECGGNTLLSKQVTSIDITTPNYPNVPQPHIECNWRIMAPPGEILVAVFLERFDLSFSPNCFQEYVELRDGLTNSASELLRACTPEIPRGVSTASNALLVKYFSDRSNPGNGFKLRVALAKCGGSYHSTYGTVSSKNYPLPGGYPASSTCEYYIYGGVHNTLTLTFNDFNLPKSENCTANDNVRIYSIVNGLNLTLIDLGVFCGTAKPPPIVSGTGYVKVVFTTFDAKTTYRGFQLTYNVSYWKCGKAINADSGVITSPGYPEANYQPRKFCEWTITAPKGRRVKLEIEDFDLELRGNQRMTVYNDFTYNSRITFVTGNDSPQPIYSTSNRMMVQYWSRGSVGSRGLKARFSSDEPTLCVGNLDGYEGTIVSPANVTSAVCEYSRSEPTLSRDPETTNIGTLAMHFEEIVAGNYGTSCYANRGGIQLYLRERIPSMELGILKRFCTNVTDETVRSPFAGTEIKLIQNSFMGKLSFRMNYKVHQCGGVFGPSLTSIRRPTVDYGAVPIDCAWHVAYPAQIPIRIEFVKFDPRLSCKDEYITIYNGPSPSSPVLNRYCKDSATETFITQRNLVFIEYHSQSYNGSGQFELKLSPNENGCGGVLLPSMRTFRAPTIQGKYLANQRCEWIARANPGQHIGVRFVDRFSLEKSVNCSKDYVELLDNVRGTWTSLGRVCGKDAPQIFNSSGSLMKVIFQTDGDTESDGFTVQWDTNCGGTYYVDESTNTIVSPNYPERYSSMLVCNYTFISTVPEGYIELKFLDFDLENTFTTSICSFDNITVYRKMEYATPLAWDKVGTYCKNNSPNRLRIKDRAVVLFRTDRFIEAKGFKFEYRLDACGGTITNSTRISTPEPMPHDGSYRPAITCKWNIVIPEGYKVAIRFEKLEMEHTDACYFDMVEVHQGAEAIQANRKALLCGNLTGHAPTVSLTAGNGSISYKAEQFQAHTAIMTALVLYSLDCDKNIKLSKSSRQYSLNVLGSDNKHLQDCHYVFTAPDGYTLRVTFDLFHVGTERNVTDCSDNFVEVRDGAGPFAALLGRFCGQTIPAVQQTFSSAMYFRYATDSMLKGTLFEATVSLQENQCGTQYYNLSSGAVQTLQTPNYGPGRTYPPNIRCFWMLEVPAGKTMELVFDAMDIQNFDIADDDCKDMLSIRDNTIKSIIYEGLGEDVIFNGAKDTKSAFYYGSRYPNGQHVYCGSGTLPSSYISQSNRVYVQFKSDAAIEKAGVRIRARQTNDCNRNYTALQGRIVINELNKTEDCTITIQVPKNYTISLYFLQFYLYNVNCDTEQLKIFDGDRLMAEYCNFLTPNPAFTSTNVMRIQTFASKNEYPSVSIDATYVATDRGMGCGGELYNYGGVFSSPLYPANNRTRMECTWTVNVPNNLVVALTFEVFDLGSKASCATDFLQIVEASTPSGEEDSNSQEAVAREHCGSEKPANYISQRSVVQVYYKKTQNFAGVGWMIKFMGVKPGATLSDF